MHTLGRALEALVAVTLLSSCIKLDSYSCAQNLECQNGDLLGTCEPGGLCSFPDATCPSGKKFGDLAGDQSGQCVGDGTGTTSNATTFNPTTSVSGDTTVNVTGTPTNSSMSGPDGTTFELTSTSNVDPTTSTDPTNTSLTTDSTTTTDPGTTTGPTCGAINQACVDGACCGSCAVCQDGMCVPASADQAVEFCGATCSMCGGDGNCAPASPGTPCTSNCNELVWQPQVEGTKTNCLAYAPLEVASACNGDGTCALPGEGACPDPSLVPGSAVLLASCDSVCLQSPDLCMLGEPADTVTPGTYCALNTSTAGCPATCSQDKVFVDKSFCDGNGDCVDAPLEDCFPYLCDPNTVSCPTKCMQDEQCASNKCQGQKCL